MKELQYATMVLLVVLAVASAVFGVSREERLGPCRARCEANGLRIVEDFTTHERCVCTTATLDTLQLPRNPR